MKKGNLIFSIVMLVLSVALSVGALLAWFSAISRASATGMSVNVSDGQLAFVESIEVYKYNTDPEATDENKWNTVATYSTDGWQTSSIINGIIEGDIYRFTVTLARTDMAIGKDLNVTANFSGISVLFNNSPDVDGSYSALKKFFLVSTDNSNYDKSFDDEPVVLTPDDGIVWYGVGENGDGEVDNLTFSFFVKFHNVTNDADWSDGAISTTKFKDCSIDVGALNINLSLASVNTDEEQGGNA